MSQLLDRDALEELKDVMGDLFPSLIDTFESDASLRVKHMREAVVVEDSEALRQVAHTFKGSAGNVCAPELAALLKTIEDFAKKSAFAEVSSLVDQVESMVNDVVAELKIPVN